MSKDITIIILGFFVALVPFLGFPPSWETALYVLSGFSIVVLTFLLRKDFVARSPNGEKKTDVYVENGMRHEPKESPAASPAQQNKPIPPRV